MSVNCAKSLKAIPVEIVQRIQRENTGRHVQIVVMDRGPGVAREVLGNLFRPSDNRAVGGAGLGLAIAHRAVIMHQGRISAGNREGGGLIVEICLPMDLVHKEDSVATGD